jgi:hypothetical protein
MVAYDLNSERDIPANMPASLVAAKLESLARIAAALNKKENRKC